MPDRQEQRDREIERNGRRRMASPFSTKIVGVSFIPGYPDNVFDLRDAMAEATTITGDEPFPAILRRNPDNEYDSNAIEVHAPVLGERGMLGHLTRPIAARMAPEMDSGVRWAAEIEAVLIEPSAPHQPGVSIKCRRVERGDELDADGFVRTQVAARPGGGGRDVLGVRDRPDLIPRVIRVPESVASAEAGHHASPDGDSAFRDWISYTTNTTPQYTNRASNALRDWYTVAMSNITAT